MTSPERRPVRVGHDERERAVRALGEHFAKGRLEMDEYEDRCARAYAARTTVDLDALFDELPNPFAPAPSPTQSYPTHSYPTQTYPTQAYPPAPFGREPMTGRPYSDKSKVIAGVLQLVLPFGVGRFYSGHTGMAIAQLLITFFTFGLGAIWPFIDGIVLLAGRPMDPHGRPMRS
ncbi:MAG: DUF1707 domain-containing protein [Pseudonocardia sp.]